jgi:hypothetical protein
MFARTLTLAGGLAAAATLSQFPEYSQQYTQRLGGAVDELSRVVADFDASARAENLTREEALSAMTGTPFVERRRADMTRTLTRYARLRDDRDALTAAGPFTRAYLIAHSTDRQIARATADAYKPALPLTFEGLTFAALGLILGTLLMRLFSEIASILFTPFRRKPT